MLLLYSKNTMFQGDVAATVRQIREQTSNGTPEHHIRYRYREFAQAMPHLFSAALNPEFDLKYLDIMLQQMKVVKQQGNTETAFTQADEVVIGKLRENYVDPLIAAAPKLDTPQDPDIKVMQ